MIENISIFAKKNDHLWHLIKKAKDHHLFGSNSSQLLTFKFIQHFYFNECPAYLGKYTGI